MKTKIQITESDFDYRTIKTLEDAYKRTGIKPLQLSDLEAVAEEFREALLSVYNLFVVFKAVNNDWEADYSDYEQRKYYPWPFVKSGGSGFDFSGSFYNFVCALSAVGSRLCTESSEKTQFIFENFTKEYENFMLKRK